MLDVECLGIRFQPLSIDDLHLTLRETINSEKQLVLANHNLHSVALFHQHADLREFYAQSELVHADGMALVLWAKLLGYAVSREQRVTYVDWIRPLMAECAAQGWRVFFVGSAPGVADQASGVLSAEFPALRLGVHDGFFDVNSPENDAVVAAVNAFSPQVLLVGMGMPRQERWILANRARLRVNAILPAGACMDYVAGVVPTPPRWMGRVGLEWLYRLVSEPKRLASRYLVEPWVLMPWVVRDLRRKWRGQVG